jgi:hypothetical protein
MIYGFGVGFPLVAFVGVISMWIAIGAISVVGLRPPYREARAAGSSRRKAVVAVLADLL